MALLSSRVHLVHSMKRITFSKAFSKTAINRHREYDTWISLRQIEQSDLGTREYIQRPSLIDIETDIDILRTRMGQMSDVILVHTTLQMTDIVI